VQKQNPPPPPHPSHQALRITDNKQGRVFVLQSGVNLNNALGRFPPAGPHVRDPERRNTYIERWLTVDWFYVNSALGRFPPAGPHIKGVHRERIHREMAIQVLF
jgi:hypothetical protein